MDRFGEHVLRVSGAQMMARAGLQLFIIQLFGRWGSMAIARYVQESHLHGNMNVALETIQGLDGQVVAADSPATPAVANMDSEQLHAHIENMVKTAIAEQRKYIGNPDSKKIHLAAIPENMVQSVHWHAACGWPYGQRNHMGMPRIPPDWTRCDRCYKSKAMYNQIDGLDADEEPEALQQ